MIAAALIAYAVIIVWILLTKLEKVKNSKLLKSLITAAGAVLLCEILLFNAGVFRTAFNSSPQYELSFKNAKTTNMINSGNVLYAFDAGECTVEFPSIGCPVDTIHFNIASDKRIPDKTINVSFSDETNRELRTDCCAINYISGNEQSEYIACSFSGKVKKLKFSFNLAENEEIIIDSIELNKEIPLHISVVRIVILMLLVLPVTAALNWKKRDDAVDIQFFKRVCAVTAAVFAVIPIILCFYQSDGIVQDFQTPKLNQVNQELVDAFKNGQVSLLTEPDKGIAALENPYDASQRSGLSVLWDHVYYKGKYYSYYGIGPVFLLFLPYNLITGHYFPSLWACCLFCITGIIFLAMTYYAFIKRFFPSISNALAFFGLLIAEITSGIWYSAVVGNFYEIAQSSGFAAVTSGAYFLIESNAVGKGKISLKKAALASALLAFAVLCRPTLAIYCVVSLLFVFFGARKLWDEKKALVKYLCAALIPFAVFGSVQMIYNALRFGSPFEFGIQYSMTINDFTNTQFHLPFVLVTIYNYLFAPPAFQTAAPYFNDNLSKMGVNGFYFTAGISSIGLIFKALPTIGYAFAGKAWRYSGRNKKAALLTFAACVAAPLIIICSIWESGYTARYSSDFNWEILFGAFVILFTVYTYISSREVKKIMTVFFAVSVIIALLIVTAQTYNYLYFNVTQPRRPTLLSFVRLFDIFNVF